MLVNFALFVSSRDEFLQSFARGSDYHMWHVQNLAGIVLRVTQQVEVRFLKGESARVLAMTMS